MFKNFTYKQKFIGVIVLFILSALAVYKKTYKPLLLAKKETKNLIDKSLNLTETNSQIILLKNEIAMLDNFIGGHSSKPDKVQLAMLDFITNSEFEVDVVNLKDTHKYEDESFLIYTNTIELKGSYAELVQLLYNIEKNFKLSRLTNVKFYTLKDYRANKKTLHLKLLFQNYEKLK